MMNIYKHVHFIGICGSGLSAIASLLLERGIKVSGSDRGAPASFVEHLEKAGADVYFGHNPENILGADLVIRSSAIPDDNPEVQAAKSVGVPVLKRADFLHQLIGDQECIAVAGTHGKTTTSAMITWVLMTLGFDPSFVVGSKIINLDRNSHAGAGKYFVIEADEYDRMFLGMNPSVEVITNVDYDHPDCFPTHQEYIEGFKEFVARLKLNGSLIVCSDDPVAFSLLLEARKAGHKVLSYGICCKGSDYIAVVKGINNLGGYGFSLQRGNKQIIDVGLQVPGEHNVLNALATFCVTQLIGIPVEKVGKALEAFSGTSRRFHIRGEYNQILIIDDYAHHPTEIRTTLAAARARFPDRRIWAVWQPHTYSRTRIFFDQYINSFNDANCVMVTEIFSARESPPDDHFSSQMIAEVLTKNGVRKDREVYFVSDLISGRRTLLSHLIPGDVVVVLSAGDTETLIVQLLEALLIAEPAVSRMNRTSPVR